MLSKHSNIASHKYVVCIFAIYTAISFGIVYWGGCNLEAYESIISAMCAHEYYPLSNDYAFFDVNLFILPLIAKANSHLAGFQLYGYYVFGITFLIGLLCLYTIFKSDNIEEKSKWMIALCFIALHTPNLMFLSTTRVAILSIFLFMYCYWKNDSAPLFTWLLFCACIIFRIDALVLFSMFYMIISFLLSRKILFRSFIPLIISGTFFFCFNLYLLHFSEEPLIVYYFYEIDLLDRSNFNTASLTSGVADPIFLMKNLLIFDGKIFNLQYIKGILSEDSSHVTNSLLNCELYFNTLQNSIPEILKSKFVILSALLFFVITVVKYRGRDILSHIFLLIFPLTACFYISLPTRFIYPYFTLVTLIFIICIRPKTLSGILTVLYVSILSVWMIRSGSEEYNVERRKFESTIHHSEQISKDIGSTLIFENFYARNWNFVTPDITHKYQQNDYHFLNFGFWPGFKSYSKQWKSLGCENALDIERKLNAIKRKNYKLIVDSYKYERIYHEYLFVNYSLKEDILFYLW